MTRVAVEASKAPVAADEEGLRATGGEVSKSLLAACGVCWATRAVGGLKAAFLRRHRRRPWQRCSETPGLRTRTDIKSVDLALRLIQASHRLCPEQPASKRGTCSRSNGVGWLSSGSGVGRGGGISDLSFAPGPCDCTPRGPPWLGRGEKFGLFEGQKHHFLIRFLRTGPKRSPLQNTQKLSSQKQN